MKNELVTWLSQVPAQSLSMAAFAAVLAFSLLQWRAIARLRRELQGELAELTSRLGPAAQATAGAPPEASSVPVLQPATLVRAPSPAPEPAHAFASALSASLANDPEPSHGGIQDYATAQRLAARGAHPDAIVERCGLSAAEAHILVAMHEMKPAHR
jgi:Protein of unknown function (DUF2802)